MRSRAVVLGAAVTVLLLATAGALYVMSGAGGERHYRTTLNLVREIQQLASTWSIETARVRSDPLADFDSLAAFIPRMARLKQSLAASVRDIPDLPDQVAYDIKSYVSAVGAREERIERFKTDYAVVRNSTRFFPVGGADLMQQAEDLGDEGLRRTVASLVDDMNAYLENPTDVARMLLTRDMETLRTASVTYPPPVATALVHLISHGEVLLERNGPTEELFREVTSDDLTDFTSRLTRRLELDLGKKREMTVYYERGILIVVGVLVLFWILLMVQQRTRRARVAASATAAAPTAEAGSPAANLVVEDDLLASDGEPLPAAASGGEEGLIAAEDEMSAAEAAADAVLRAIEEGRPPADSAGEEELLVIEDEAPAARAEPPPAADSAGEEELLVIEDEAPAARAEPLPAADSAGEEELLVIEDEAPAARAEPLPAADSAGEEELLVIEDEAPAARAEPPPAANPAGEEELLVIEDEAPAARAEPPPAADPAGEEELLVIEDEAPAARAEPLPAVDPAGEEELLVIEDEAPAARAEPLPAADPAGEEELLVIEDEAPAARAEPLPAADPAGEEELLVIEDEAPAARAEPLPAVDPAGEEELLAIRERLLRIEDVSPPAVAVAAPEAVHPPIAAPHQPREPATERGLRTEYVAGPDEDIETIPPATGDVRREAGDVAELARRLTSSLPRSNGEIARGMVDVNACIDEVVEASGAEASAAVAKRLGRLPEISASRADIRLLLEEIVRNSVLAVQGQRERPGAIKINTARRNDEILITISDNGVGMTAEVRENLFHAFHVSQEGSRGVGLALANHLAEKHEGAIRINSLLNHGTVARITLPIGRSAS